MFALLSARIPSLPLALSPLLPGQAWSGASPRLGWLMGYRPYDGATTLSKCSAALVGQALAY
uniref:Uncharacterized protein n=1 Tax=Thermogemmatispora argillosa TaxID=2045280 RepID=A0A455T6C0_9CHLR|nr:hypothetical protein KTA_14230 [Thermogemmatispora argillosa]